MNAPNPPHWILNSCLCASRSVWSHLAMFHYYTKLGAKRVELVQLMQKFVPRSRIIIFFCNERTQFTPLDHKLMFWCIALYLGAFGNVSLLHKLGTKRVELVQLMQKFVPWSRIRIFRNECTQSTPLDPKLVFWCVPYSFVAFWTVWLTWKLGAKRTVWMHPIHTIRP